MTVDVETLRPAETQRFPSTEATFEQTVIGGYMLEERIGVGGYGEVWKAIGPGGLVKAVKVLYGHRDGPQAEAELRSLERMRDLRHPFLLNIERIDICDGRVIVVTELAEGSLQHRFDAARRNHAQGIPRDELLAYLRDAAEALDFMNFEHGLQHLDVKPENLLFQGSHIKVGDFGLTKDISANDISQVVGFTPLYSPPELFEGRPGRTSDQYSLAIVYQLMLTGTSPFSGRTAAQLTAQHLSSRPDLQELQPIDRPAVARALSKTPSSRFDSCREFVDELCRRQTSRSSGATATTSTYSPGDDVTKTRQMQPSQVTPTEPPPRQDARPVPPSNEPVTHCPLRPTLFVGLGGIAGNVLASVQQRLRQQFKTDASEAFSFLYVDSDPQAIGRRLRSNGTGLDQNQVLSVPLKQSAEYRKAGHLEWLSRRWLFNIPRSGQVDGMRPLGRLTFVDHLSSVRDRLRKMLSKTMNGDSQAAFVDQTGVPLQTDAVDVVLVASTSGGFGSGSVLDFSYLIRDELAHAGVGNNRVCGVLLHSTGRSQQITTVQEANTLCCLKELRHFATPGLCYNGAASSRAEVCRAAPFDHTYLLHVGDELNDPGYSEAVDSVVDYLHAHTSTAARSVLEAWRTADVSRSASNAEPCLRTVGVGRIDDETQQVARNLCRATARRWSESLSCDVAALPKVNEPSDASLLLLEQLGLTEGTLEQLVRTVVKGPFNQVVTATFDEIWSAVPRDTADCDGRLFSQVVTVAVEKEAEVSESRLAVALRDVRRRITESTRDVELQVRDAFVTALNDPADVARALDLLANVSAALDRSATACRRMVSRIEDERRRLGLDANVPIDGDDRESLRSAGQQTCALCIYLLVYRVVIERIRQIRDASQQLCLGLLHEKSARFREVSEKFHETDAVSKTAKVPDQAVILFEKYISTTGRVNIRKALQDSDPKLASLLMRNALEFLLTLAQTAEASANAHSTSFPGSSAPRLNQVGGARHVLAVSPGPLDQTLSRRITAEFGDCLTVCESGDDLTVFCEVESIQIPAAIARFVEKNEQLSEFAERVHTRVDIEW